VRHEGIQKLHKNTCAQCRFSGIIVEYLRVFMFTIADKIIPSPKRHEVSCFPFVIGCVIFSSLTFFILSTSSKYDCLKIRILISFTLSTNVNRNVSIANNLNVIVTP